MMVSVHSLLLIMIVFSILGMLGGFWSGYLYGYDNGKREAEDKKHG